MHIAALFRDAWRITWRNWPLWLLNLLILFLFSPAVALGGAFGGLAAFVALPWPGRQPPWLVQLKAVPAPVWGLLTLAALALLVLLTALSWILQAAAMRGAALAAEHGTFTLTQALSLGRQRIFSLLKLSVTFGLLLAAFALLPPLGVLLLSERFEFGVALMQFAQTGLAPINAVLSVALLLVMMSVALEDLRPRAAFRQAWRVFQSGWWGFLLVVGVSFVPAVALALLIAPVLIIVTAAAIIFPNLIPVMLLASCGVLGLPSLIITLFAAVFTLVLYTLVYREAAQRSAPAQL